jgi:hypothetical protein
VTPRTTRQLGAQGVNRVHNASTTSMTCQPRTQRVNREHNASTASTTRQPGAQRVARTRPMCATHCLHPRCIARHSQCVNSHATTTMPFSPAFSASCPMSLNPTTRQPPRERRVNRVHDASTACTRCFPLSPLCSPCESDSEQ